MKTFVINSANCAEAYASSEAARQGSDGTQFATEKDLERVSAAWPIHRLLAIWNKLPGVKPVRKFRDRRAALRRLWPAIQGLAPERSTNTKTEIVIGLLTQPAGATLKEIMAATGWQAHSVRGFICAQVSKKRGLRVKSFKCEGERVYRIR